MFGALFFVGVTTGSLILPRLSDKYGRRIIALVGNSLHLISGVLFLISHSLNFSLFLIFLMGIGMGGRVFVGYIFMTENMRIADSPKATAAMFTFDAMNLAISAMYFKYNKDWHNLFGIPLLFLAFAITAMFLEEDTPKFVFTSGDYERTRAILTRIGRKNGMLTNDETYDKKFRIELEGP